MTRRVYAVGALAFVIVLVLVIAGGGGSGNGYGSDGAGASSSAPRVGEVVLTDSVLRPADDCGSRRPVRAFEDRLRPRREPSPSRRPPCTSARSTLP